MKSLLALPHVLFLVNHGVLGQQDTQSTSGVTLEACPTDQQWSYSLTTDDYPWETSWELVKVVADGSRHFVASGPEAGTKYSRRKTYGGVACLDYGEYRFTLRDSMGDGFCCDNGQGQWVMALGEQTVARVTAGQFRTRQVLFQVGDQTTTTTTTSSTFATTTTNLATTTTTDATTTQLAATTTTTATTAAATTTDSSTSSPTSTPTATAAPTTDPWLTFNPRHSKFCGPKVVGGFAVAVSQCGPKTMCGLTTQSNHYGSHGNDCPKGLMCYSDIVCQNGPNAQNAISSSGRSVDGQYYSTREESLDGRTIGSIKSNEVVLKQDLEHGRWVPEEERMDALHEDNANVSTMRTLNNVLYCAIVGVFAIMNPWFS